MSSHRSSYETTEPPTPPISNIENNAQPGLTNGDQSEKEMRLWTSLMLRRTTMGVFMLTWTTMLATLVALGVSDQNNDGIVEVDAEHHIVWTYGPTAGGNQTLFPRSWY